MEKKIKLLRVLMWIWLALGVAAMLYVLIVTKKSNLPLALIFIVGFSAIALPLRKLTDQQRQDQDPEQKEKTDDNDTPA